MRFSVTKTLSALAFLFWIAFTALFKVFSVETSNLKAGVKENRIVSHELIISSAPSFASKPSPSEADFPAQKYGNFCVYKNVLQNENSSSDDIVMMLHLSLSYFSDKMLNMVATWEAPISIAIFVEKYEQYYDPANALTLLKDLAARCDGFARVFAHIFTRQGDNGTCPVLKPNHKATKEIILPEKNKKTEVLYPINVARNIARRFAPTHKFFLVADLDQEYSISASAILREIAHSRDLTANKEVLVVRRFEHAKNSTSPRTVAELKLRFHKDVYEFHELYFRKGHAIKGVWNFLKAGDKSREVVNVSYSNELWEPMFVAPSNVPEYDETLRYQAMNQLALCWDLCVFGYQFLVVDGVFNSHEGLKKPGVPYAWPSGNYRTTAYALARAHRRDLKAKNPDDFDRCFPPKHKPT